MREGYSQHELLLLSNFVYIPACISDKPIGQIIDSYRDKDGSFTERSVAAAAAGGGMSVSDVRIVFTEMDKAIDNDPEFGTISASRRLNEPSVRGICYTDEKDGNPVVVFRGTGGTKEAWTDNFEGAYLKETKIQHIAGQFVKNECAIYRDITVTGHSKGGNLAQYVTVRENARVRECISFDGQGFGDDFISENKEAVRAASPKICSVSAYNYFVNILLVSIAGRCIYVANEPSLAGAHSPTTLLTNNTFDEDGNFISIRAQSPVCAGLDMITDRLTEALDPFPQRDKKLMSEVAGAGISGALTSTPDGIAENSIAPALGVALSGIGKRAVAIRYMIMGDQTLAAQSVSIDTKTIEGAAMSLASCATKIVTVREGVEAVRGDIEAAISVKVCAAHALTRSCEELERISLVLNRYADMLSDICRCYKESELAALMIVQQ
ncbi:MAG: DUF2974 domain-containing protein [Lachnospiraceae bacterium]|nr:DUF2974 domain-containing protein [Lachnospiraceae bacterium]